MAPPRGLALLFTFAGAVSGQVCSQARTGPARWLHGARKERHESLIAMRTPSPRGGGLKTVARQYSFPLAMAVAVAAARLRPSLGVDGGVLKPELTLGRYGVTLIFFLSGAGVRFGDVGAALRAVRMNVAIQLVTFAAWPVAGLAVRSLSQAARVPVTPALLDGVVAVSCLPTTVNMCVVLTQAAGGNVALALTNAVMSNMLGVVVTPLLLAICVRQQVALSLGPVCSKLARAVLLPVALGQVLRSMSDAVRRVVQTNGKAIKLISEAILVAIVYNTFCNTFASPSASALSVADGAFLVIALPAMYMAGLGVAWGLVRSAPVVAPDAVAAFFAATQKTLAFGLPLLRTIFASSPELAFYTAPILMLHPLQLVLGSCLVPMMRELCGKPK